MLYICVHIYISSKLSLISCSVTIHESRHNNTSERPKIRVTRLRLLQSLASKHPSQLVLSHIQNSRQICKTSKSRSSHLTGRTRANLKATYAGRRSLIPVSIYTLASSSPKCNLSNPEPLCLHPLYRTKTSPGPVSPLRPGYFIVACISEPILQHCTSHGLLCESTTESTKASFVTELHASGRSYVLFLIHKKRLFPCLYVHGPFLTTPHSNLLHPLLFNLE